MLLFRKKKGGKSHCDCDCTYRFAPGVVVVDVVIIVAAVAVVVELATTASGSCIGAITCCLLFLVLDSG